MSRTLVRWIASALLWCTLPAAAALTGSASGVVKDGSGVPLPGVTITIGGPSLQGVRTTVTRPDGGYSFFALPPGAGYRVEGVLPGFKAARSEAFAIRMDLDTQVPLVMQLAAVASEIVVSAEAPVVDVTQTQQQQNFTSEYLRKIPIGSANRSYQSIPAQSSGVVGTGNPNVYGGNILENAFLVDGVNTTDPVTHTFSFNLNFDAIQEVSLQKSGYDAEFGRASGGIVNVVTKSGGNTFSGSFDIRYDNNKFTQNGDEYNGKRKFDNSLSKSRNTPWGVTFGGPVLRDQLWFFLNAQRRDEYRTPAVSTNTTVSSQVPEPAVRAFRGWNTGGKLSFTLTQKLSGFFAVNDAFAEVPGVSESNAYRPEAASTQEQKARIYSLKADAVLNDRWMVDVSVGLHREFLAAYPSSKNDAVSLWINNSGGGVYYDNYYNHQQSDRNRDLAGISATRFVADFLGSHQIKAGLDLDRTVFPSFNYYTGTPSDPSLCPGTDGRVCGAYFLFNGFDAAGNRIPYRQYVFERLPTLETKGRTYDGYIQDQWHPVPSLTVNIGLRWDESKYFSNTGRNFVNFVKLQPRVGIAYDPLGDGKTALRANYGQFYVDPALTFNRLFYSDYTTPVQRMYQWDATAQTWVKKTEQGGVAVQAGLIDGSLLPTYDDQVSFSVQRELTSGVSVTGSYLYKKTNDIFDSACVDLACTSTFVSNQPGSRLGVADALRKSYYAYTFELQYQKGRVFANASYVFSKSRGSIDSSAGQYSDSSFNWYPEGFDNRYGYLSDDARHRLKVFGNYRIPFVEADLGASYQYRSGLPYDVTMNDPKGRGTLYVVPRGTDRIPVQHQLDLELRKGIRVLESVQTTLIGSVLNVLDSQQATGMYASADSPTTLRTPSTFQRPRGYQIGFRLDWQ